MNIKLLKTDILSNNIPNFLIFIEEEQALGKQYINSIANTIGKPYRYYDNADSAIHDMVDNIKEDCLYVIYNDNKIIQKPKYIEAFLVMKRHIIVVFDSVDKRSSFYKDNSKYIVEFNKLDTYSIVGYLNKILYDNKISIAQGIEKELVANERLTKLVEHCERDLGKCLNELDKIITLGQENSSSLFEYMENNGFSDYREEYVFRFVNNILDRNMCVLEDRSRLPDGVVTVLYNLYNEARNRLISTKNQFYASTMKLCSDLYNGIIDGTISDKYAMSYLLLKLL